MHLLDDFKNYSHAAFLLSTTINSNYNNAHQSTTSLIQERGLGKKWDSIADNFVRSAFNASIIEIWTRLKQNGYLVKLDDIITSLSYQDLISKKEK